MSGSRVPKLLLLVVAVAGPLLDTSGAALFLERREISAAPEIPQGSYTVWAWAPSKWPTELTWDLRTLRGHSDGPVHERQPYEWMNLGTVEHPGGAPKIKPARGIALLSIAPSDLPDFDPARVIRRSRVFEPPDSAKDARADDVRHTDTVYRMPHFADLAEWNAAAEKMRKRILISSGLYPLPERHALNAHHSSRIQLDDYSVENVYFEAWPGFYVTGNLYRPVGEGPFPAVLMPHGHWEHGRLEDSESGSVPARAIAFARLGAIAFTYDMIGYNDSRQFEHRWVDPAQKLWGIHPFAMQLWSSIRALDFLESLPDVDATRLGCTGASGGGTQTFALTAVDSRVAVSAPVNMISSTMQGGCICENAPIIRLDNSNMEIGAMMAPRPLLLVSATGDWTRETPRVEFPAIRSVYELFGAAHRVESTQIDAGHNYNLPSREAVYRFFGKWLLDIEDWASLREAPYKVEPPESLRVFPGDKLPEGAASTEEILETIRGASRERWEQLLPDSPQSLQEFQYRFGDVIELVTGAKSPSANDVRAERLGAEVQGGVVIERWVLGRKDRGDAVPALLYRSPGTEVQDAVIVVHSDGKAALVDPTSGLPGETISALIGAGKAVLSIDAFLLGEHHSPLQARVQRVVGEFGDTFNPTLTGKRIQDVLTAAAFLRSRRDITDRVDLIGLGDAGLWCMFAAAIDRSFDRVAADANGFDPESDSAWVERFFIPCIRSVGGIATVGALIAPRPLLLASTDAAFADRIAPRFRGGNESAFKQMQGSAAEIAAFLR